MRVEHEYERRGAWAYIGDLDVHQARVLGRWIIRRAAAASLGCRRDHVVEHDVDPRAPSPGLRQRLKKHGPRPCEIEDIGRHLLIHTRSSPDYGAIGRLLEARWIERFREVDAPRDRQAYRLTSRGRNIIAEETRRMKVLTRLATVRLAGIAS